MSSKEPRSAALDDPANPTKPYPSILKEPSLTLPKFVNTSVQWSGTGGIYPDKVNEDTLQTFTKYVARLRQNLKAVLEGGLLLQSR